MLASALIIVPQQESRASAGKPVSYTTSDGWMIKGDLYLPGKFKKKPAPVVILLPMYAHNRNTYAPFIPALTREGYIALAIDLRGHGESTEFKGKTVSYKSFRNQDFMNMVRDVAGAVDFIKTVPEANPERIGIVGASIGANLAINYALSDRRVRTAVLLSPGLNYKGITTEKEISRYGKRSVLIVTSQGDDYSFESAQKLIKLAQEPKKLEVLEGDSHGTDIFNTEADLVNLILNWVLNHLLY